VPRLTIAALAAMSLLASACAGGPSEADCARLYEHTLAIEQTAAGVADPAKQSEEQKALVETTRPAFMDTCLSDLPKARVRCALAAETKADLLACDER
jgi:hypothetical protein